ncbi:hypothetical protein GCM10009629_29820 [Pseudonocardia alni]
MVADRPHADNPIRTVDHGTVTVLIPSRTRAPRSPGTRAQPTPTRKDALRAEEHPRLRGGPALPEPDRPEPTPAVDDRRHP